MASGNFYDESASLLFYARFLGGFGFEGVIRFAHPLLEPINAAAGIQHLFLAGIERVALTADFYANFRQY